MRMATLVILLGTCGWAQALVEHAAAAAGGTAGGVAGKKVSDALSNIFEKVDKSTAKAATADKPANPNTPLFEVGPGVPHPSESPAAKRSARRTAAKPDPSSVPPPPPVQRASRRTEPVVETASVPVPAPVVAPPPPPPPPQATPADLKKIAVGENRQDILKLGFPAIHITMYDNGHMLETFRFVSDSSDVGVVRLTDGTVSSVQVN